MSPNNGHNKKVTHKQNKAILTLLDGGTQAEAALVAGVTPKTVHRWIHQDAAFFDALKAAKSKVIDQASTRLAGGMNSAIDTMLRIMADETATQGTQLRAANFLLTHALRVIELADVLERIDALEMRLNQT